MKKILFLVIPIAIIAIAAGFFSGKSNLVDTKERSPSENCLLTPEQFTNADKTNAVIIDVRTQREYNYGHLKGAILVDIYSRDFKEQVGKLDKSKKYFVYCKTGIRSRNAANYMRQTGFKNVCDLQGGTNYLARSGLEFVR